MKFMGNVQHRTPRQKDRLGKARPVNHENIDVHRDRTLKRLAEKAMGEIPSNTQKESNSPRSATQPKGNDSSQIFANSAPVAVYKTKTVKNDSLSSVSPLSYGICSGRQSLTRKCLKDGKIVTETIIGDEELATHPPNTIQNHPGSSNSEPLTAGGYSSKVVDTQLNKDLCEDFQLQEKQVCTFMNKLTIDEDERHYHAYLNCSDEHIGVAKRMLEVLEKPPFNFRLFFPPRQILPGGCELDMKAEIVETRCSGKVITLLSKENESSSAVHFINHFAKSLDPVSKGNKLIPVIIEDDASIPRILHGMYMIRFDRDNERGFIWEKLSRSLRKCSAENSE